MKKTFVIGKRPILCLVASAFALLSCAKVSPSRRSLRGSNSGSMIDGDLIAIERSADGLSATISFATVSLASCSLAWYEDNHLDPEEATLNWQPCISTQPGRVFKETAAGLKPELSYVVAVKTWAQGSPESTGKVKRVHENAAPGDPNNRYTLRVDLPTMSAQIDGYTYAASLDPVKKDFLSNFPCKALDSTRSFPGTRIGADLPVKRVTSRGFYSGISVASEDLTAGLVISGAGIQTTSSEWVLNIQSRDTSGTIRLTNPGQLVNIAAIQSSALSTTTSNTIIEKNLDDVDLAAFRLSQTSPLTVTWTSNQVDDQSNSVVIVTLTSPTNNSGIICGFDPKSGSGSISAESLAKLGRGRGFLTVRLESLQQPTKDRWFARIVDWRSLQVLLQ